MLDLIILGAGPAGITAGIYAARKRMKFLLLTKDVGGQATWSGDVENYIGFQFISGFDLVEKFREHLEHFKADLHEEEPAVRIERAGQHLKVVTGKGVYEARTVIIATGRTPRLLGAKGEEEFRHRGVTYCATCDGPLFSDMDVAVIGGGNAGFDAVLQLMNIARNITVVEIQPQVIADPIMVEKARASGKVAIHTSAAVEEIYGSKLVEGIRVRKDGELLDIPVRGVFVEIGSLPASDIMPDLERNKLREVTVDCKCRTNVPGVFAAGDVTDVPAKQIIVACGEGCKALLTAFEYISTKSEKDW